MATLSYYVIVLVIVNYRCLSSPLIGDECKVHIDNRHLELKQLIDNQIKFDWNNWSHLISLLILGFLVLLLVLAYCFIKIKYWPTIKHSHHTSSFKAQTHQASVIEKPYIIHVNERNNPNPNREGNDNVQE